MDINVIAEKLKSSSIILKRARDAGCSHVRYRKEGDWLIIEGMFAKTNHHVDECLHFDIRDNDVRPVNSGDHQFTPTVTVLGHSYASEL